MLAPVLHHTSGGRVWPCMPRPWAPPPVPPQPETLGEGSRGGCRDVPLLLNCAVAWGGWLRTTLGDGTCVAGPPHHPAAVTWGRGSALVHLSPSSFCLAWLERPCRWVLAPAPVRDRRALPWLCWPGVPGPGPGLTCRTVWEAGATPSQWTFPQDAVALLVWLSP